VQTQAASRWAQRFVPKAKVFVVPNPVLPFSSAGTNRPCQQNSADAPKVLGMGRLIPLKGFDKLIRAFATCSQTHPDWHLIIVGEGPERPKLQQLIEELGVARRVALPGRVTDPAQLLGDASLFVLSSAYEGFPNALCEAMAVGLPVISFDCPFGPREIIRDGYDGLLVPADDEKALAAALGELMSDSNRRASLGHHAREITHRFSLEKVMNTWEEILAKA
jgi:glycosyltransferase involved in cell wall biosynthesis